MQTSPVTCSRVGGRSAPKRLLASLFFLTSMLTLPGWAAMVTTNEVGMDDIFSDDDFGMDTIDIRFNDTEVLYDSASLLKIDNRAEFNVLKSSYSGLANNIVRMFFVDAVKWCGGSGTYAGCGDEPGHDIVVDSDHAANTYGHVLNAHELGHNLDLDHVTDTNNVMKEIVTTTRNVDFLPAQVDDILNSQLIQFDGPQRFISITPILVSAAAVPIPGALILCASAIASLGFFGGSKRGRP